MRGGELGEPLRAGTTVPRQRLKRRYDIALPASGAEIRLPTLPIPKFGWRLVSGLLTAVLLFALYTLWNSPLYRVKAVEIEGLKRLTPLQINAVLGVVGEPIFTLQQAKMRQTLETAFPQLTHVSVQIGIPARVQVSVTERQPVLVWKQNDRVLWVDAEGVSFPVGEGDAPSLVVEAESDPPPFGEVGEVPQSGEERRFLPPQLLTALLAISTRAPQDIPLIYNRQQGLGWRDVRGWMVYFGMNVAEIEMKLRVYDAIINYLVENQIRPETVSIENVHAPYYRLER
jgi:hypothetical protein